MKKVILSLALLLGLGELTAVHAQIGVMANLLGAGINAGRAMHRRANMPPTPTMSAYEGRQFPMQRMPADQLPKKGAEPIVAMETELDRCHAAMLASPTGPICTPEQRTAIQTAIMNLARAGSNKNLPNYQQEANFYLTEDTRRQQAAAPAEPAK
jgi:hypothetical protein